jgi:acyl-coenzyme A thioesterase PaaI-like protein
MGDRLEAEAEVLHAGKRLYRVEMRVFSMTLGEQQARTLVAKCSATFMLVFPTNG